MADFSNAYEYFRAIYKRINIEDIEMFEEKYRNSEDEITDLIQFYNK